MYFKFIFFNGDIPPAVKHLFIKWTAKRYGLKTFIETGTAYGDTVAAVRKSFNKIYSIELNRALFESASIRFCTKKNIDIVHGDSPKELSSIMLEIYEPCLFWLDAHWSGGVTARGKIDTPVIDELKAIEGDYGHVILIDDCMHLFDEVKEQAEKMGYSNIKVFRNIIRLTE